MRKQLLLALIAASSIGAWTCGRDERSSGAIERRHSDLSGASREDINVFVVDDDLADCPKADFTSIQAAVTAAGPGDRILVCAGTYHEQVTVSTALKNDLTIVAKGKPGEVIVNAHGHDAGFLVLNASGVTIEGFRVEHAHEADIELVHATFATIRENVLSASEHDGVELLASDDNLIEHNVSIDNPAANACGINLAAGSRRNLVRHNMLVRNEWGIQIAGGLDNVIFDNQSLRNRGNGIRNVGGASGTMIENNRSFENGLTPGPLTGATAAGIRIGSGANVVVARNHAFDNLVVDLRSDVATATFEDNHCNTSSPPGLCEHEEGEGH
jgi:pectin methylesterase-like acyl-CoA thioesterase